MATNAGSISYFKNLPVEVLIKEAEEIVEILKEREGDR